MTSSAQHADETVAALIGAGVADAVLSPGSRSAPLAFALAAAERTGRLRLHVRIDERSAGFLALGLAKAAGRPVPVVVTSGTAVANLFPAVVEASASGVPLLVLSADRPPPMRGVGASQTIDQLKVFGGYVREFVDVTSASRGYRASVVGRAVARATDPTNPGPVHLNLPFAAPLVPQGPVQEAPPPPRAVHGARRPAALGEVLDALGLSALPERGLIVAGDGAGPAVADLARACGWPIVAEPTAGLQDSDAWVPGGAWVAGSGEWLAEHRPELVVSVGRVGLSRALLGLLEHAEHHVAVDASWADPTRTAAVLTPTVPVAQGPPSDGSPWLADWLSAGQAAARAVDEALDAEDELTGLHVARHVWRSAEESGLLFLAASWPIRQAALTQHRRRGPRVLANRGANGIDGLVSTAWGAALAHPGPSVALLGDLAFLHDGNGLIVPAAEQRPPLTFVVIDNNGGGIFSQLEQAAPQFERDFERLFGTPHGLNLVGRSRLSAVPARGVHRLRSFAEAMQQRPTGVSVVVAQVAPRAYEAALLARLQQQADAALG